MSCRHVFDKASQRLQHVRQRLSSAWFGKERDEVHGMALAHGHADLRIALEAADAGTMPGSRVEHDHGGPVRTVAALLAERLADARDAQQGVVDRPIEMPSI